MEMVEGRRARERAANGGEMGATGEAELFAQDPFGFLTKMLPDALMAPDGLTGGFERMHSSLLEVFAGDLMNFQLPETEGERRNSEKEFEKRWDLVARNLQLPSFDEDSDDDEDDKSPYALGGFLSERTSLWEVGLFDGERARGILEGTEEMAGTSAMPPDEILASQRSGDDFGTSLVRSLFVRDVFGSGGDGVGGSPVDALLSRLESGGVGGVDQGLRGMQESEVESTLETQGETGGNVTEATGNVTAAVDVSEEMEETETASTEEAGAISSSPSDLTRLVRSDETSVSFLESLVGGRRTEECPSSCKEDEIGDGRCDSDCDNDACSWDGGDCSPKCAEDCRADLLGDGECQVACFVRECAWDGGDCIGGNSLLQSLLGLPASSGGGRSDSSSGISGASSSSTGGSLMDRASELMEGAVGSGGVPLLSETMGGRERLDGLPLPSLTTGTLTQFLDPLGILGGSDGGGGFLDRFMPSRPSRSRREDSDSEEEENRDAWEPEVRGAEEERRDATLGGAAAASTPSVSECSPGCKVEMLRDRICDQACNTEACGWDEGDCTTMCNADCRPEHVGDGWCDQACNTESCNWDEGDCADVAGCPGCFPQWMGDGSCDPLCNTEECGWDQGDCEAPAPVEEEEEVEEETVEVEVQNVEEKESGAEEEKETEVVEEEKESEKEEEEGEEDSQRRLSMAEAVLGSSSRKVPS
uniref:LNR domain-containing protein n=1 Tax=Chromera velia CCMP2878 TaxID=1169474 RepID=A0A0G4EZT6_9ALVE|eukprot:Cvel_2562.t1-p1 / transcript=Cvel_2562.t1 / gene=Cvel_2562 / organism=Chromera_velia_CCMP2878 / gene_product=Neurogenic locus notch homolog protein 3, putative / transcript_product=Neurogenic locus notch homolog protein 3, putative / location=Cvel_scaffold101:83302-85863(-) / protein_length=703 / sequence_SO=supercontig / SO=protein_coding / is_pseudo=false